MPSSSASSSSRGPAYRVETGGLVLRCWSPADAPRLRAVLDRSDAHLRPYIPFMRDEPRTLAQTAAWLRGHRASFDLDRHHRYAVLDAGERTLLGEVMLLDRHGDGEREVGYWLDRDHVGHGHARTAAAAMTRLAFELTGVDRVELHCAPGNTRSAALAARLGFVHEATLQRRARDTAGRVIDLMMWTMFRDAYPTSAAAAITLRAYDCLGERLL